MFAFAFGIQVYCMYGLARKLYSTSGYSSAKLNSQNVKHVWSVSNKRKDHKSAQSRTFRALNLSCEGDQLDCYQKLNKELSALRQLLDDSDRVYILKNLN